MVPITVPRLGWSMEEGTFVEWLAHEGDVIKPGDELFVLESDKSSEEIEAIDSGILHIPPDSPKPGTIVKVGQVLGYVLAQGESAPVEVLGRAGSVSDRSSGASRERQRPEDGKSLQGLELRSLTLPARQLRSLTLPARPGSAPSPLVPGAWPASAESTAPICRAVDAMAVSASATFSPWRLDLTAG